jgi:beta-barrel assembly-enhancing protease
MKKALLQFTFLVLFFFGMWKGLSLIPWVKTLHVKQLSDKTQQKFGEAIMSAYHLDKVETDNDSAVHIMNEIKQRLCDANAIDTSAIHLHIFQDEVINAFALPGGHIIVNTGLIKHCDNADMLAGVLAHEIAHIRNNHLAEKMTKEIGISAIIMASGGSENAGIVKSILKMLVSTHFDREQETDADNTAIIYLEHAEITPKEMASLFKKIAAKEKNMPEALKWINTHPYSLERADNILKKYNRQIAYTHCIDDMQWAYLQDNI